MCVNPLNLSLESRKYPNKLSNRNDVSFGTKDTPLPQKTNKNKKPKIITLTLASLATTISIFLMIKTNQFAKFRIKKQS